MQLVIYMKHVSCSTSSNRTCFYYWLIKDEPEGPGRWSRVRAPLCSSVLGSGEITVTEEMRSSSVWVPSGGQLPSLVSDTWRSRD